MPASPLFILYSHMVGLIVTSPNGDTAIDAEIASVLTAPPLPYTSNDAAAQTLLPSGWSWSTTASGTIICVRDADSQSTGDCTDGEGNHVSVPTALARSLAAVEALLIEDTAIS